MSILILFSVLGIVVILMSLALVSILLFGTASIEIDSKEMHVRMTWTRWLQIQVSYITYRPQLQWRFLNIRGNGIPLVFQKRSELRPGFTNPKRYGLRQNYQVSDWQAILKKCRLDKIQISLDPGSASLINILTPMIMMVNCLPNVKVNVNRNGINFLYAKMSCIPFELIYTYFRTFRQIRY